MESRVSPLLRPYLSLLFLLPAGETTTEYLKQLVAETNDIYVADEEFLSDNVYIYKRESEQIEILE